MVLPSASSRNLVSSVHDWPLIHLTSTWTSPSGEIVISSSLRCDIGCSSSHFETDNLIVPSADTLLVSIVYPCSSTAATTRWYAYLAFISLTTSSSLMPLVVSTPHQSA